MRPTEKLVLPIDFIVNIRPSQEEIISQVPPSAYFDVFSDVCKYDIRGYEGRKGVSGSAGEGASLGLG